MTSTSSSPDLSSTPGEREQDARWVAEAQDGDRAAFGRLVERYQRRVYALAFGIVRNREEAWDIAQEAFVKAYKNLGGFAGQSAFYTWLYRITYNLSLDHLRSRARRDFVDLEHAPGLESAARSVLSVEDEPGQALDRKQLGDAIKAAMEKLSEKHRAIIVLREIEGLSYEEMAEVLEISKGTVMSRLFHARRNLQAHLRPYLEETGQLALIAEQGAGA